MIAAGFANGSEFLWAYHHAVYWDLTQRTYREEMDPGYDATLEAGIPFCPSGTPYCDADYDPAARAAVLGAAVGKIALTGHIGKPLITLHGTLDTLLPIGPNSDAYAALVRGARRDKLHRYYVIEGGNHVDQLYDEHPDKLRPIAPCHRAAFIALEQWVEGKGKASQPPPSRFVPRPSSGDLANECAL